MSSMHSSVIDEALAKARALVGETTKTASADGEPSLVKEAEEIAGALEFVALSSVDDGSAAGSHQRGVLENFFAKAAAKGGQGPAESVSKGGGTQSTAPAAGKTHIPVSSSSQDRPAESLAPTGTQATIGQEPVIKSPPTESASSKKAGVLTLYDLIAGDSAKEAEAEKEAAKGGPADSVALDDQASPPKKNENTNIHLLRSNEAPVKATKRQAKMPTRARLKKLWAGASDTTGDATAKAIWPQAASKGSTKVADLKEKLEAMKDEKGEDEKKEKKSDKDEDSSCKEGSAGEWSQVFQLMLSGDVGEEAKAFAQHIDGLQVG